MKIRKETEMKIYVTHSNQWEYVQKLYQPLKQSRLEKEHEIYYPHDEVHKNQHSKETISSSDLVIAEVSLPATGMGVELGWAEDRNVPILCISREGYHVSSALKHITENFIVYQNEQDMIQKIEEFMEKRKN